jgi:hypothetical protein
VSFLESLSIPTAGTWLIIGNFKVEYLIIGPSTTTTTQGFFISGFGLEYYDLQQMVANTVPYGVTLYKQFSVSAIYNGGPVVLSGHGSVVESQQGTKFSGNVTAVKIA